MLTSDERRRLNLVCTMGSWKRKDALNALRDNFWDTSMAVEWLKLSSEDPNADIEKFHQDYEQARAKSASAMPVDRYDLESNKKGGSNRAARRAEKKKKKKV